MYDFTGWLNDYLNAVGAHAKRLEDIRAEVTRGLKDRPGAEVLSVWIDDEDDELIIYNHTVDFPMLDMPMHLSTQEEAVALFKGMGYLMLDDLVAERITQEGCVMPDLVEHWPEIGVPFSLRNAVEAWASDYIETEKGWLAMAVRGEFEPGYVNPRLEEDGPTLQF